ncbi:Cyclic AMP-dependent transcription factor ATF-5 [Liparis tanakae]|uniref:Cyclic AMP-dependent transcription factor ATF-5 n=1 Tax=Liparis tanakae TaxID=230148 RepID=A0A4Z2EW54_9TELE|nr:Cyclic AMP-dependent transcription factor ATF-5 [Liparis tanakae]
MTEKVDLSSFVSPAASSPRSSLPPSPLAQDVKVPSDLEVMTSLLQEELAQLEDYFRSESTPAGKLEKAPRCDRGAAAAGSPSYYQLPYGSYGAGQSESPVVVTLATGELDLAGFCGGAPVGRTKVARPAPYNYHHRYHHHHHGNNVNNNNNNNNSLGRRAVSEAAKVGEDAGLDAWGPRGSYSGGGEPPAGHYSTPKTAASKSGARRAREGAALKEEDGYCFSEGVFCSEEIARGFCLAGAYDGLHRRPDGGQHSPKLHAAYDGAAGPPELGLPGGAPQETMAAGDGYFHHHHHHLHHQAAEPYHSFIGDLEPPPPPQAHAVEPQHGHYLYPECLADQSYECLSRGDGEGAPMGGAVHRPAQRLKDEPCCAAKPPPPMGGAPPEAATGERKQKKRDQNKTAAHRYRLRKRAELDLLEEELHGLEGQNRELRDKAESVEREIQYVKDLLIEVYKARSQRHKQDGTFTPKWSCKAIDPPTIDPPTIDPLSIDPLSIDPPFSDPFVH